MIRLLSPDPPALVMIDKDRQVDLHPCNLMRKEIVGSNYPGGEHKWAAIRPKAFGGWGSIGNRRVRCLSPELQLRFHQGHELAAEDEHDVRMLKERVTPEWTKGERCER
jgi:lincosamide nucleotidyltransferase A/C/D/E